MLTKSPVYSSVCTYDLVEVVEVYVCTCVFCRVSVVAFRLLQLTATKFTQYEEVSSTENGQVAAFCPRKVTGAMDPVVLLCIIVY